LIGAAIIVAVLLLVALLVVLGLALRWYLNPENKLSIVQRRDLVQGLASAGQALAVFLTGAVGLTGLFFTWRNTRLARESTQETLELTEQGQITERFTRAIDQLGATDETTGKPRLEIRLGGIYALERIAWDSPERDYSTVMEVLTAYVRENTPQAPWPSEGSSDGASTSNAATAEADEGEQQPVPPEPGRPTADIQAILDVLKRSQFRVPEEYRTLLDLSEADLQGANLHRANLQGASLQYAKLQKADLQHAKLQKADFHGANLTAANLRHAKLQEADLSVANLQGAKLQGAFLQEANLSVAFLQGANLTSANLQGAFLQRADLRGADLQYAANLQGADLQLANLQEANLHKANLQEADFQLADLRGAFLQLADLRGAFLQRAYLNRADLQGANLQEANLHRANLQEADFQLADLQGANLYRADLRGAFLQRAENLTQDKIGQAIGSDETQLPENLIRPEQWSKNIVEQERILIGRLDIRFRDHP